MSANLEQVAKDARSLSRSEKAILAQLLLQDLDDDATLPPVEEVELVWLEESMRRYNDYKAGHLKTIPAAEAVRAARQALR